MTIKRVADKKGKSKSKSNKRDTSGRDKISAEYFVEDVQRQQIP